MEAARNQELMCFPAPGALYFALHGGNILQSHASHII